MADKGGLEGIVVARSRLCSIDGHKGVLIYGGYDVGDLAEHSSYEEVCFLTMEFYRRNYIEGLFLSSGALRSPDYTMEQLVRVASLLRQQDFGIDMQFTNYRTN